MNILYLIIFFLVGLAFGSFYTVVGLRLPRGEDFITNNSYCDKCHHKLSLIDMVPIVSYLLLKGRCRYCKAKIDTLSSYMELYTGILFALSYYTFGFTYELLIALGLVSMLIILSVSDITYLVIPDEVLIFFAGYYLIVIALGYNVMTALFSILSGIALFSVMYAIMLFGNFLFKKESLGGGDIKMMFVFGLIFHPIVGLLGIFLGSVMALPVSLFMLFKRNERLVPFGPFLLISFTFLYFMGINFQVMLDFVRIM